MKLTEISSYDWKKYNFNKVFNALPKEVMRLIQDMHNEIPEIYPAYEHKGKLKDDVAPIFCQIYFDIKRNKIKKEEDITLYSLDLADRINLNFNDDLDEKDYYDDEDEDDRDSKDSYEDDEVWERLNSMNSCAEEYLDKFAKMWKQGKFK